MKSLLRLKPYLRPFWGLIFLSALLAIPLAALRSSPAPLVKYYVDDLLVGRDPTKLALFPLLIVGVYVLNFLVRYPHYYLLRIVVVRINQKIKNDLYDHLLGLSADYFTAQSTGTLMSRVANDPTYLDIGLSCINIIVREPITFLLLLGYALKLNWKLTLVSFLIFPPLAWVFSNTGRNLKRYLTKLTEENAKVYSTLQESFSGIRVVKTFRLEKYVRRKFRDHVERTAKLLLKISMLEEAAHPAVELLLGIVMALMLYFGGRQVLHGRITAGDFLAFFITFGLMVNPIKMLNEVNMKIHQAAAAADRIFQIFDWKPNLHESVAPQKIREFKNSILLDKVTFAYPDAPERNVLRDVSFEIPKGRAIALVGASGAGKSSLVSLLPRIFDVTGGGIRIDGVDIREYSLEDLRRLMAVVSQDVFLFNDTIEENIRCGKLGATAQEIREAAKRAHVTEFVDPLPDGFQTQIGDRGQKLSGGQRQRISIARAFLREAPILILDEATSSLDTASERVVKAALEELMQNRTTLMIAHRLSTIQSADQIYVMREGQIIESGKHEELLKIGGEYANFYYQPAEAPA